MKGTLLFDGDCGFCTASAHLAMRVAPAVRVVPWQRADLTVLGVSAEQCSEALQYVGDDGARGSGATAVGRLLRASPGGWPLAGRLLMAPGVVQVAGVVYRFVADHRGRLPGVTPACQRP